MKISLNFDQDEFECPCSVCNNAEFKLDNLLLDNLQEVRTKIDKPLVITSGYRCTTHNIDVGGKKTSSHLKGRAADIATESSYYRFLLLRSLLTKFNRIGIGSNFIHVDVDIEKPENLIWVY